MSGCVKTSETSTPCHEDALEPRIIGLACLVVGVCIFVLSCAVGRRYLVFRWNDDHNHRDCQVQWDLVRKDRERFFCCCCFCFYRNDDDDNNYNGNGNNNDDGNANESSVVMELRRQRIRQQRLNMEDQRAQENRYLEYVAGAASQRVVQNHGRSGIAAAERQRKRRAFLLRELKFDMYHCPPKPQQQQQHESSNDSNSDTITTTASDDTQDTSNPEKNKDEEAVTTAVAVQQDDDATTTTTIPSVAEECAICLDRFVHGDEINATTGSAAQQPTCPHVFHKECLLSWLAEHDVCPCCRVQLVGPDNSEPTDCNEIV